MTPADWANLAWAAGWLVAVFALFAAALGVPLQLRASGVKRGLLTATLLIAALGIGVVANIAVALHDVQFDATLEGAHTPSAAALAAVDGLDRPVRLTYLYQGTDEAGQRARELVELMGRRNPLLTVETIDPDKKPAAASRFETRFRNTAVLEAEGRRIVVASTDETEIAIGIQRVLRQKVVAVCFIEGHNEYTVDSFEFHTHLEGLNNHNHNDSSSKIIETTGHGIGRLRRSLETLGFEIRRITPATQGFPPDCALVIAGNPRTTWLPSEAAALERYLAQGGSALLMFDLGFELEPGLATLLDKLGIGIGQAVVIDPRSHYGNDPELLAVGGYDPHAVTKSIALTLYPGARPLTVKTPAAGLTTVPLVTSGPDSTLRAVESAVAAAGAQPKAGGDETKQSRVIAAAVEGKLGAADTRVIVTGDADFASNSYLPYMSNNNLALSMVRWLVKEDKLATLAPRVPASTVVLLTAGQMQGIFVLLVVLLPLGVLSLGVFAWWRNR